MQQMYKPLKIFIATPGDLIEERRAFIKIITEVNYIKAHNDGFHLEPIGWEQTLPGVGRPQELINEDLKTCDLFIMILWERWGTPSGKYSSGTEEEYAVSMGLNEKMGKPEIWVLFKEQVDISEDKKSDIETINALRHQIEQERRVFYKQFSDVKAWEELLRACLCKWIDKIRQPLIAQEEVTQKETETPILVEISYMDIAGERLEIYFTIKDSISFENWRKLKIDEKEAYLFNQLSQHLYLTLGANPYVGIMRYDIGSNRHVLLGSITFEYGALPKESKIYLPIEYDQILHEKLGERKLLDFWVRI